MTLTEIKEKIVAHLGQMTIDDFFLDYNIATRVFTEAAKDEIESLISSSNGNRNWEKEPTENLYAKVLTDKYYESTYEYFRERINNLKGDKYHLKKQIELLPKEIDVIEKSINEKIEFRSIIQNKKETSEKRISELTKEIETLKPLAEKDTYASQVNTLENSKDSLNKHIEEFSSNISQIETDLKELHAKSDSVKEEINELQTEIDKIESDITAAELAGEENREREEYASLEFLCIVLLYREISKNASDSPYLHKDYHAISYNGKKFYIRKVCEFGDVLQHVSFYLKQTKHTIPNNWRKILFEILANPIPEVIGVVSGVQDGRTHCFIPDKIKLKPLDASFLIALKMALKPISNCYIKTSGNKIILGLSGGISATLSFRDKDSRYSKLQKQETEIYANGLLTQTHAWQTLYTQTGYANSAINIEMPYGYYILTTDYLIEINFSPAPILFDSNNMARLAPNISSKLKREDEARAEDIERKRQEEQDAYWEKFHDDDF